MKVKFIGKLQAIIRKQCFKRSTAILDRNFEFTDFIFENLARGLYASRWPGVT